MPAVSVVIAARDAERTLAATLRAVTGQGADAEVVVVDNGSLDATAEVAADAGAIVIRRARGQGPGPARNAGAARATAPVLAFTDADCVPQPAWLAAGLEAIAAGAELVEGAVVPDPAVARTPLDRTVDVGRAVGLFQTANLFVTRRAFDAAGGFPDGLEDVADVPRADRGGAPFGEDTLFGWTVVRTGAVTTFVPGAVVHHEVTRRPGADLLAERRRTAMFAALVRRVPELRGTLLHRGIFLQRRHELIDLALAGTLLAAATRRAGPLGLALPLALDARRSVDRHGPRAAAWLLAADAVSAVSTARGALAARTLVL